MLSNWWWALPIAGYVGGWSMGPMFDRLSMASGVPMAAISPFTLSLAALIVATYLFLFTDGSGEAAAAASRCVYVLASGACIGVASLSYFRLLSSGGMMAVVLMQPALLIVQTTLAAAVLKEPVDRWKLAGVGLAASSMVLANWPAIRGAIGRSSSSGAEGPPPAVDV
jgi:uncharacterized membrane protein